MTGTDGSSVITTRAAASLLAGSEKSKQIRSNSIAAIQAHKRTPGSAKMVTTVRQHNSIVAATGITRYRIVSNIEVQHSISTSTWVINWITISLLVLIHRKTIIASNKSTLIIYPVIQCPARSSYSENQMISEEAVTKREEKDLL